MVEHLILLKLGGSLITDKTRAHVHRPEVLGRLAQEIAAYWETLPRQPLIVGHGSGSFGHIPARQYGTRRGVHSAVEWRGFAEVWWEARQLNQLVIAALIDAGLPAIAFPPSACMTSENGKVTGWDLRPLQAALEAGLLPVVNGDVAFDAHTGGTILSTEDVFIALSKQLPVERILLAGVEEGVWADYPSRRQPIFEITPNNYPQLAQSIRGSEAVDVTGGMAAKVETMLSLIQANPKLEVTIFSGLQPGHLQKALAGDAPGTAIRFQTRGEKYYDL